MKINLKSQSCLMLYAYCIANGLLYSLVFWGEFNINVLQYASPYDLLPSIVFIVILPLFLFVIYMLINVLIIHYNEKADIYFNNKKTKAYRNIKLALGLAAHIFVVFWTFYTIFFKSGFDRYFSLAIVFIYVISYYVRKKTVLLSEAGKFRDLYFAIIIALPLTISMVAHYRAEGIKSGYYTYLVDSDSDCTKNSAGKFRYIASIGDKAFAYSLNDDSLCVFKYNYLHLLDEKKLRQKERLVKQTPPEVI
ncbi:hypothetical protein [Enterobacter asburiae]|uniref:hypothetical protein n=1 Tax=Enterobacter asburiae TaxID=61645 RepID=UPI00287E9662|nr:hypothetical protein [Enterobacter asburiae]